MGHKIIKEIPNSGHLWKSHVPSLSIKRYNIIDKIDHEHGFSLVITDDEGNELPRILCTPTKEKDGYFVKNAIHFTEKEAARRLAQRMLVVIEGKCTEYEEIDKAIVIENYKLLCDKFPECVI